MIYVLDDSVNVSVIQEGNIYTVIKDSVEIAKLKANKFSSMIIKERKTMKGLEVICKVSDTLGNRYFLVITKDKKYIRNSSSKALELLGECKLAEKDYLKRIGEMR